MRKESRQPLRASQGSHAEALHRPCGPPTRPVLTGSRDSASDTVRSWVRHSEPLRLTLPLPFDGSEEIPFRRVSLAQRSHSKCRASKIKKTIPLQGGRFRQLYEVITVICAERACKVIASRYSP